MRRISREQGCQRLSPHTECLSCFPWAPLIAPSAKFVLNGLSLVLGKHQGVMNSGTSKGWTVLAQAPCWSDELTVALFDEKALCPFGNKILACGQRSMYTDWMSLFSCYAIPFTIKLWKQSSEEVLECLSSLGAQKQVADVKMTKLYPFIWWLSEIYIKDSKNKLFKPESTVHTHFFLPTNCLPSESCGNLPHSSAVEFLILRSLCL